MKQALSFNLCNYLPRTLEEEPTSVLNSAERLSDAALLSPLNWPMTPTTSSHRSRFSRSSSKSSKVCHVIAQILISLLLSESLLLLDFWLLT